MTAPSTLRQWARKQPLMTKGPAPLTTLGRDVARVSHSARRGYGLHCVIGKRASLIFFEVRARMAVGSLEGVEEFKESH